ncbi:MAG: hypothetical protein KTR25_15505 [Myxococcales bacterium]|nr:hypothetical protein [Myxococcales bacterium]
MEHKEGKVLGGTDCLNGRRRAPGHQWGLLVTVVIVCCLGLPPAETSAQLLVVTSTMAHPVGARVVEQSVAQVDRTVFTFSELLLEARLMMIRQAEKLDGLVLPLGPAEREELFAVLAGKDGSVKMQEMAKFFTAVLSLIVQRALLMTEVQRLQLREVAPEDIQTAYERLIAMVRSKAVHDDADRILSEAGFGPINGHEPTPALAAILRSERAVDRIEAFRRASRRDIPEEDLKACYESLAVALGRPGYAAIRASLEREMRSRRFAARLREQLQQLAQRVEVRYSPPFRPNLLEKLEPCPPASALFRVDNDR